MQTKLYLTDFSLPKKAAATDLCDKTSVMYFSYFPACLPGNRTSSVFSFLSHFLYFAHTWFGLLHIPRLWALTPVIRFVVMRIFILVPLWLTLVIFMSSITVRSFHANDMSLCGWESLCVCVCVCTHGSQLVMWEADQSSKRALTTGNHPVLGPGQSTSAFLVNLMFNNSQWIKVF